MKTHLVPRDWLINDGLLGGSSSLTLLDPPCVNYPRAVDLGFRGPGIQSGQLTNTRYFGGWSNTRKDGYLERCEMALIAAGVCGETEIDFDVASIDATDSNSLADASDCESGLVCEHCGSDSLTLVDEIDKPSWTDVLGTSSEACPDWYRETLDLDDRRFWDAAMGEGFSHLVRLVPKK